MDEKGRERKYEHAEGKIQLVNHEQSIQCIFSGNESALKNFQFSMKAIVTDIYVLSLFQLLPNYRLLIKNPKTVPSDIVGTRTLQTRNNQEEQNNLWCMRRKLCFNEVVGPFWLKESTAGFLN